MFKILFNNPLFKRILIIILFFLLITMLINDIINSINEYKNNNSGYFSSYETKLPKGEVVGIYYRWDDEKSYWVTIKTEGNKIIIVKDLEYEVWASLHVGTKIR